MTTDPGQLVSLDAPAAEKTPPSLFGLDLAALTARMVEAGEPAFRGRQLAEAIYRERVTALESISTLPRSLRESLAKAGWQIARPRIAQIFQSVDGTERYLVDCGEETVETVWMPEGDGGESGDENDSDPPEMLDAPSLRESPLRRSARVETRLPQPPGAPDPDSGTGESTDPQPASSLTANAARSWHRATICVSSQVGCAVGCRFCLTARLGLKRNLTTGEIAGQVLAVFDRHGVQVGHDRVNLVFMGMGEPFLNYENFMAAVRLLVQQVGLSPRRMTVSTSGIVPGIERFGGEPPELRPKLAISLNAPNDAVRGQVMPINQKWPIDAVMQAVHKVKLRPRERLTFEYVLLGGVTDQPGHAREVARLARKTGMPVKVNLIAWNPGPGVEYATPSAASVEAFRAVLTAEGIPSYLRRPRGRDIYAACGQLKRTVEG